MANDGKWTDWRSSEVDTQQSPVAPTTPRVALLQLLGCVVGLGALTVLLPAPVSWVGVLNGNPAGTQGLASIGATAETAILVTASVLVWSLLGWVLAVCIAAVAGRLPGTPGRCGRALLRRIAPAVAGRIVATAVGVTLFAGTSACAVPAMGDLGSGAGTEVIAGSTTTSTPAPLGGGAGVVDSTASVAAATPAAIEPASLDELLSSISIDWPAVVSPTGTVDTAPQSSSGAPVDTTAAPTEAEPVGTTPAPTVPAETTLTEAPLADTTLAETTSANATPTPATAPAFTPPPSTSTTAGPGATEQTPVTDEPAPDTTDVAQPSPTDDTQALPTPGAANGSDAGPTTTPAQPPSGPATSGADSPGGVAVSAGDTLWSIAHHHLKPDATDQEIDTAWRAWYSANSQVIGDNPDLIQPGQLLLPPDPEMGR